MHTVTTENTLSELRNKMNAYVAFAMENLMPEFQKAWEGLNPTQVSRQLLGLETHLLFPNLSDDERGVIADLQLAHGTIALGCSTSRGALNSEEKRRLDGAITRVEIQFVELKREIAERRLIERLTPLQKQFVEDLLSVPLSD